MCKKYNKSRHQRTTSMSGKLPTLRSGGAGVFSPEKMGADNVQEAGLRRDGAQGVRRQHLRRKRKSVRGASENRGGEVPSPVPLPSRMMNMRKTQSYFPRRGGKGAGARVKYKTANNTPMRRGSGSKGYGASKTTMTPSTAN